MAAPVLTPRLFLYVMGLGGSALGDAIWVVTLPFAVFAMLGQHDPVTLAHVMTAAFLPRLLGLLWGSVVDRFDLRHLFIAAGLLRLSLTALLGVAFLTGSATLVLVAAFLNGLLTALSSTSGSVLVPHLVPREVLTRANSLIQSVNLGLPLLGYGLGGALVAALGSGPTLLVSAVCFGVMPLVVGFIRIPTREYMAARGRPLGQDLREGLIYLRGQHVLLLLGVAALMVNLTAVALNIVIPALMERVGAGARGYGLYEIVLSTGMIGGVALSNLRPVEQRGTGNIPLGLLSVAAGLAGNAATALGVVYVGAAALGLGFGLLTVSVISYFQAVVPTGLLGRVMGVLNSANAVGYVVGAVGTGAILSRWPATTLFAGLSGATLVLFITVLLSLRAATSSSVQPGGQV